MESAEKHYDSLKDMYLANYKLVNLFITDYCGDKESIEEISSIVWLKVAEYSAKCLKMDEYYFRNYLRAVVRTVIADYLKEASAVKKVYEELKPFAEYDYAAESIDSGLFEDNKHLYLRESVKILSHDDKLILYMKYGKNLSSKEIGELLGIADGAVRMRLYRITGRLKAEIARLIKKDEV